jgi:hypothetical protein
MNYERTPHQTTIGSVGFIALLFKDKSGQKNALSLPAGLRTPALALGSLPSVALSSRQDEKKYEISKTECKSTFDARTTR